MPKTVLKKFSDLNFNEMVDRVAGDALLSLVNGHNWRTIIFTVATSVLLWKEDKNKG